LRPAETGADAGVDRPGLHLAESARRIARSGERFDRVTSDVDDGDDV
jgi:hypothetical protein